MSRVVFAVSSAHERNNTDRVIVLNDVAKSAIDSVRGEHPKLVFTCKCNPLTGINSSGWKATRRRPVAKCQ